MSGIIIFTKNFMLLDRLIHVNFAVTIQFCIKFKFIIFLYFKKYSFQWYDYKFYTPFCSKCSVGGLFSYEASNFKERNQHVIDGMFWYNHYLVLLNYEKFNL